MSDFLNDQLSQSTTDTTPTRESRASEAAEQIKQGVVDSTRAFVDAINTNFDLVWNNPYGLAPGEVADALGDDALAVFSRHAATADFLVSQASAIAELLKTRPDGYTVDYEMANGQPTGRVTITKDE